FVMFYLNDQIAGQTVDVQYDPDPDQMVSKIQQGLNTLFGTTGTTPNFKAFLVSTQGNVPGAPADKIEISATNTGLYAGVNIDNLSFETRNEVQTINFTGISSTTSGSFDINSPFDFRTVNWSPDPNILLNGGTDACGNLLPLGLRAAFSALAAQTPGGTATVTQVSNTQFTVTFGGTLGNQDLLPNPGPAFTIADHLVGGG